MKKVLFCLTENTNLMLEEGEEAREASGAKGEKWRRAKSKI